MTQLPKTVDYSVDLMSMKQKCLQQFQNSDIDMSVMCGGSEFQMAGPA